MSKSAQTGTVNGTVRLISYRKIRVRPEAGILPTELLPLRSLDQVSQNQVLTRKGGTSLMQKPGSTSKKSDANAFNSLEGSRIGLASKMDSKTHHYIGRLRALKGAAGVATYAPFYPAVLGFRGKSLMTWSCAHLGVSTSIWSAADRLPGLGVAARSRASGLFVWA